MRLPTRVHTARPWRIHELARDFRVEDVWVLPTPGGPDDFTRLMRLVTAWDPGQDGPLIVRALFAIRWKLGELAGWDGPKGALDTRVRSLRERLPLDLREGAAGPLFDALPFRSLYLRDDEWAAEVANDTMHGILHLGWVPDGSGGYRGEMAVYVKPNGLLGSVYMAAIRPIRYRVVYPAILRELGRIWRVTSPAAIAP